MTESTRSGKPDSDFEPSGLVEMVSGEPMAAAGHTPCSAEQLSAITESLVKPGLFASCGRGGK